MATFDLQAFVRERVAAFNSSIETGTGSAFDREVLQPLLRRLGTDPWTIDVEAFLQSRLQQAFPDLAVEDGDMLADALIKPLTLLLDPVVREVTRVNRRLSIRNAKDLTSDEADDLGANLLATRELGSTARGTARLYFQAPQNVAVNPSNVVIAKGGLRYFPSGTQQIRLSEMLMNQEDGLYYFDVLVEAEAPGAGYNLDPGGLQAIGGVPACVRVTNKLRFQDGINQETAEEFVNRLPQSLSERSLVTLRGMAGKLPRAFPEIRRLNAVGFGDPEMKRDVLTGGSLGRAVAAGRLGMVLPDGDGQLRSRFFVTQEANFQTLLTDESGYVLTVFDAFGPDVLVEDLEVRRVVDASTLETVESRMLLGAQGLRWQLRRRELLVGNMPGGVLIPQTERGEAVVLPDQVHVGGATDVLVSADQTTQATLIIDRVTDQRLELVGDFLRSVDPVGSWYRLGGLVLGTTYQRGDATDKTLRRAVEERWVLEFEHFGTTYRYSILGITQTPGEPTEVQVDQEVAQYVGVDRLWSIYGDIEVSLNDPAGVLLEGSDLAAVQGSDVVVLQGGLDLTRYGVQVGSELRILSGPNKGSYGVVSAPLSPGLNSIRVSPPPSRSLTNQDYRFVRPNASPGIQPPWSRITSVGLLGPDGSDLSIPVPLRDPVDCQTRAFQNPGRGVKHELGDFATGIVSRPLVFPRYVLFTLELIRLDGSPANFSFAYTATSIDDLVDALNAAAIAEAGYPVAIKLAADRFGFAALDPRCTVFDTSSGLPPWTPVLLGDHYGKRSTDIQSETVNQLGSWSALKPQVDFLSGLDVIELLEGPDVGPVAGPYVLEEYNPTIVRTAKPLRASVRVRGRMGSRSIGSCRAYWLEPTTVEALYRETVFTLSTPQGVLRYRPDPTLGYQLLPAQGAEDPLQSGQGTLEQNRWEDSSVRFGAQGVRVGDTLKVLRQPLVFSAVLPENFEGTLENKTLVYSLDGGIDRTITFFRNDLTLSPGWISRQGVVDQINAAVGVQVCSLVGPDAAKTLRFQINRDFTIRRSGTANALLLGQVVGKLLEQDASVYDQDNDSPARGQYTITQVSPTHLQLDTILPINLQWSPTLLEQEYQVERPSAQRIGCTQMSKQTSQAGLYWADFELVSDGVGDVYNIQADLQLTVEGLRADGYRILAQDQNYTFSPFEESLIQVSGVVIPLGSPDDRLLAEEVAGKGLKILYERTPTVENVQSFIISDTERVVTSNPMARQLIPNMIRLDVTVSGGRSPADLQQELERYIRLLSPAERLEVSEIVRILHSLQVQGVQTPITILNLVYGQDRTVWAQRSQSGVSSGRLSYYLPERIRVTRTSF